MPKYQISNNATVKSIKTRLLKTSLKQQINQLLTKKGYCSGVMVGDLEIDSIASFNYTSTQLNIYQTMNRLLDIQSSLLAGNSFFNRYRTSSTIDSQELKRIVYGPNYQEREKALDIIKDNPQVFEHFHYNQASRESQRQLTTRQFVFLKKKLGIKLQGTDNPNQFTVFGNGFTFFDLNLITKMGVHYSLYLKIIERLGTTQLHRHYYQRACAFKDFGCFALTELMHGSNVRGLLTQARYDHATKELIIHTPSKDAMKFWIGGSAKTSNMCVVWAQLYIKDKCYGVHAIIVPLREESTHKVLPGITIGDCGPKFGLNGIDNGFIEFNHFRVPVTNLLNKVSGINQQGNFVSTTENQSKRFGMTLAALSEGRMYMCCHSTTLALSALAIAIRYTFVRQQFSTTKGQTEKRLIEYPLTIRRMVPLLAQQIVYMCVTMNTFYTAENNEDKNNLSPSNPMLKEIHAISSVLKAKTAWAATEAIRQCRQMMGGHGYSAYSKMAALYSNNDVNNTWEGQNNVLLQQTTKYVIENYQRAMQGKEITSPLLQFLKEPPVQQPMPISRESISDLEVIRRYLMGSIVGKASELGMKMMSLKEQKMSFLDIWNNSQVYLGQTLAMLTADLYILDLCVAKLNQIKHEGTKKVFKALIQIWALTVLRNDESINERDHSLIEKTILEYSQTLVPELLGVLESVVAGEEVLGSPFANERGEGFKKYMNYVLQKPRSARADYWQIVADEN